MELRNKYGSLDETYSLEDREERQATIETSDKSIVRRAGYRKMINQIFEEYDPGGKKAHAIAAKYHE